jgi:hypothetical protein
MRDDVSIQFLFTLFTTKMTCNIVNNGAKVTHLGDRMNSLSSALVSILMENTNDITMLFLYYVSKYAKGISMKYCLKCQ